MWKTSRNPRLILRWVTAPAQALFSVRPAALWRPRCVRRTSSPPAKIRPPDAFREVRDDGTISPLPWREATFELAGRTVRCAVASGLGNARQLLHSLQRREVHYEFVEIMACPGGCAGGGGQPVDGTDREKAADRGKVLFRLDQNAPLRFSHENPAVQALYREYLDEPCSHRAEELLHCDHFAWQMNASR